MANNFYQTNNKILKLDPYNKSDLEKLQFNQYLCRKENLQRIKNEIDRGLFKLSYTTMMTDTGLSRNKLQRLIKWFEEAGIIECIEKSNVKGKESIYAYTSVYYEKNSTNNNTDFNTNLSSNSNTLDSVSNTNNNTNNSTSKKEKEKENKKTSTSTKTSSISYTEMVTGTAIYKDVRVDIKRFNGEPKRFAGNMYIEQDGYIYEIHKKDLVKVEKHSRIYGYIKSYNGFGVNKELEDIKIKDPA